MSQPESADGGVPASDAQALDQQKPTASKALAAFDLGFACPMLRHCQLYALNFPDWPRASSGVASMIADIDEALGILFPETDIVAVDAIRAALRKLLSSHHRSRLVPAKVKNRQASQTKRTQRQHFVEEECHYQEACLHAAHALADRNGLKPVFWLGDACGRFFLAEWEGGDDASALHQVVRLAKLLPTDAMAKCETIQRLLRSEDQLKAEGPLEYLCGVLGQKPTDHHRAPQSLSAFKWLLGNLRADLMVLPDECFATAVALDESKRSGTLEDNHNCSVSSQVELGPVTQTAASAEPSQAETTKGSKGLVFDHSRRIVTREGCDGIADFSRSKLQWAIANKIAGNKDRPVARESLHALWPENGLAKNPADRTIDDAVNETSKTLRPLGLCLKATRDFGWLVAERPFDAAHGCTAKSDQPAD